MKRFFVALAIPLAFSSCSELEVEGEVYPDSYSINTSNINTSHPLINVEVDMEEYNNMYRNFEDRIVIRAKVDYYTPQGDTLIFDRPADIEVKGATSARKQLKSLGIVFDQALDNDSLNFFIPEKIIANHDLSELKTIRLRNSGNDFNGTMIKDMVYTQIAIDADMNLELMYGRPVIYFVNDQYQGLLNMRTESNAHGISHLFGVDSADVCVLKVDNDNGNLEYDEGDVARARQLIDAIRSDDYQTITELVDLDNFIDYIIFQDYIGNHDWPHNNSRAFSVNGGKFRFLVYDLDFASFNTKNPLIPELEYRKDDISKIFQAYMEVQDDAFFDRLHSRMAVIYKRFDIDQFLTNVDLFARRIEEDVKVQIGRYNQPTSMFEWRMEVDQLKREMIMRDKYIRRKYDLE